ncbi:uncharacterized protein C16C9.01c [Anaerolineaceae bacterium]|nr:uncharacterized protein C16C9.01c [Anaerolineaceae bacterium]
MPPVDLLALGIIIDDLVLADGTTQMGLLGGGGPQTAFGMRLWSERVGLAAGVGADFPQTARDWLQAAGIDTSAVRQTAQPTLRAWQLLEADGRHTQVWRSPSSALPVNLALDTATLPATHRSLQGLHTGIHPEEPNLQRLQALRAITRVLSIETWRAAPSPPSPAAVRTWLQLADIFSPNLREAESLVGAGEPLLLAQRLIELGGRVIALRMGAAGVLVCAPNQPALHLPALEVRIATQPLGAGNAFCGGFLAGWAATADAASAAAYGTVAASFMLEQPGLPPAPATLGAEAQRRLQRALHSTSVVN